MTEESQRDKLKQHFARRVTTQARLIIETWQRASSEAKLSPTLRAELLDTVEKLTKYARRFEMEKYDLAAQSVLESLESWPATGEASSDVRSRLDAAVEALSLCTLRRADQHQEEPPRTLVRMPIFLALNNQETAHRIARQMEFFGFRAQTFTSATELLRECAERRPETIVIDVNFGTEPQSGIAAVEQVQAHYDAPIPILYLSEEDGSIETRLRASRSGGEEFFYPAIDPGQLIEKIERYTHANPAEPYRVLVLDDSRAQAKFMENTLNRAGMTPHVITDPMQIITALEDFSPEIILLDMYMPGCTGMEVARVIRQQDSFHSVPIIYLSAEDDVGKQLHAMSLGGDDFLTKPIDPKHLIATLHNRGRRARSLLALMVRDSLTGLYNHTHTLHLLDNEISRARANGQPLTYVILDLDNFKQINGQYGHSMGDRVLRSLSLFLKQRLRKTDHIGRYGGEEFALVLPDTRPSDARTVLNEIRERFGALLHPAGDSDFRVTFSAGLTGWDGESAQQTCDRAEQALAEAKQGGRNRVVVL
ncbi:MAG: diguanylate cyclase response regulator [Alteromonadaceae bacterium]|nr:diguanylate cyclase response regulator [Alteromonadaceae bacterium]